MGNKKLIEVALPLEKINAESAREKSIRHGHPSTLHLWWARRPLAAARAVIWSSLIDDPSSHPEKFPTEEDQNRERQRLFKILEDLVVWENSNEKDVLDAAKTEILKSTHFNPPILLDPFAGGGTIPLEAQRLGLEAHAHDLNPVAVLINKALIDIPPRFENEAPVNPDSLAQIDGCASWMRADGLADDVRYYGEWVKKQAFRKIGHLYPAVTMSKSYKDQKANVIAWLWTRTTTCPNPTCGCEMPLASSFVLSRKKGHEAWVKPIPDGKKIRFEVQHGKCPKEYESFKMGRSAVFKCPICGEITTDEYVKQQGQNKQLRTQLMAIVAEGQRERIYLSPNDEHSLAATIEKPQDYPSGLMPENPRWFSPPAFGMNDYSDLFTNRQLVALTTFCDLIPEAQKQAELDAIRAGFKNDHISLRNGGYGAQAYGEAIGIYLAFAIDRLANRSSSLCLWNRVGEKIEQTFGRQAIPMVWDYAESNVFGSATGSWSGSLEWIPKSLENIPCQKRGIVQQFDAQSDCGLRNIMVATDPPYYDNIGYADLSDYFYIWLRHCLKETYPDVLSTMLVPKKEELIATPYRFEGGMPEAKAFFESGMLSACKQICQYTSPDYPVTIFYAFKQSDTEKVGSETKTASSGWETMLSAIINSGMMITGTWPMHTERETGLKAHVNALASSIVLVCRKRNSDAPQTTRRNLVNILRREIRPALKKLQDSNIAPVDLAQSAIGPGMGVFSRYRRVLEADGSEMSVRSALQLINEEVDLYFNEQVGSMDAASRFCVDLYTQYAYNNIKYGEAEILANAKSTSIPMMASHGVLYAKAGVVHLVERADLPEKVDTDESNIWMLTQQLTRAMAKGGIEACAQIVYNLFGTNAESAKDLAYRLYTISERKGWTEEAYAYNALVVAWPDIQSRAAALKAETPEQLTLF